MAMSAGPYYEFDPSNALFVVFDNEEEIDEAWTALIGAAKPYDALSTPTLGAEEIRLAPG